MSPISALRDFAITSKSWGARCVTFFALVVYLLVMFATNGMSTILDDEASIVTLAGHPVIPTLNLFLFGPGQHEHPPASDIFLHAWLITTGFSFAMLRVFANLFYAASVYLIAKSAEKIGGARSYWITLGLGLIWPFAFQYGRITGWYCMFLFLVSLLTWIYLHVVEDGGNNWDWLALTFTGILLIWTNYFSVAVLLMLFIDMIVFHHSVAAQNAVKLTLVGLVVIVSLLPLLNIVLGELPFSSDSGTQGLAIKSLIAVIGYPLFAVFGSAAVAPWYWPLSMPIGIAAIVLLISVWCSPGRKWLLYSVALAILLTLSAHMDIKRVLFLLSWLFFAIGIAASCSRVRVARCAVAACIALVVFGWIGIFSGRHYATTNLYEPWRQVATTVAHDLRRDNATVISDNFPFFLYLNYQLGVQSDTADAHAAYLDPQVYAVHGYKVLSSIAALSSADKLRGEVILVAGSGIEADLDAMSQLRNVAEHRCRMKQEYQAAPDPALALKKKFVSSAPALAYRTDVAWYQCPAQ